jgi:hypothetical protein
MDNAYMRPCDCKTRQVNTHSARSLVEEPGKGTGSRYLEPTAPGGTRGNHHQLCHCSLPFTPLTNADMGKDIPIL